MKLFLLVGWLITVFTPSFSQLADPLVFQEKVHDFGDVKEKMGPVKYEFNFTNRTSRPVKILDVQASCGCTTPGWTRESIPPGKNGFIAASYDPKGRPGFFNKSLSVTTDWDGNPMILQIKGNVIAESKERSSVNWPVAVGSWRLKTNSFNLGKVFINKENTAAQFYISNAGNKPISINKLIGPPYMMVEYPARIEVGKEGIVKIKLDGKARKELGYLTDNIEFWTDDELQPVKSFSVYATVEEFFPPLSEDEWAKAPVAKLENNSIDLGRLSGQVTVVKDLKIRNTGKKDLMIRYIHSNCICVEVKASKMKLVHDEEGILSISFTTEGKKGQQFKSVTLYTNDPRNPTQRILVSAFVE